MHEQLCMHVIVIPYYQVMEINLLNWVFQDQVLTTYCSLLSLALVDILQKQVQKTIDATKGSDQGFCQSFGFCQSV